MLKARSLALRHRPTRVIWIFAVGISPFVRAICSRDGLLSPDGRLLIWGKVRRAGLALVPPLARKLQRHYGLEGGCRNCGFSCRLLFQCPHWDANAYRCSVYADRPHMCRLYPITPADIRDRDIAARRHSSSGTCGFAFADSGDVISAADLNRPVSESNE